MNQALSNIAPEIAQRIGAIAVLQFTKDLATTDKKGNRVSFERSIAFASKADREGMTAQLYEKQCNAGRYGRLVRDSLAGGVLNKAQRDFFEAMVGSLGDPKKELVAQYCAAVVGMYQNAEKQPKGQKAFYVSMLRSLHNMFTAEQAPAAGTVSTVDGATIVTQ